MRIRLLLSLAAVLLWLPVASVSAQAAIDSNATSTLRVLFIGNSLTYVNNLPRLLQALAAAQPDAAAIATTTFAAPGGAIAERWDDGHAAEALRNGHWDALVLQERGGLLACLRDSELRREGECRAAERAHRDFARLAVASGTRVLLLATWGPGAELQRRMDAGIDQLAARLRSGGADVQVVPAGSVLRDWARQQPDDAPAFSDGVHPGLAASLIMAAQLYRALTGHDPQARDVVIDFPLLPRNAQVLPEQALERQPQLAGDGRRLVLKAAAITPLLEVARASH